MKKQLKKFFLIIGTIAISIAMILLLWILAFTPFDFSQDYKEIPEIENVVFQRNGNRDIFYKRTFWGLKRRKAPAKAIEQTVDEAVREIDAFAELMENTDIHQAIFSPDGDYILYCEIIYNYKGTGVTDDEYCCYKVFDIATGESVQIYGGYRAFYNLGWL